MRLSPLLVLVLLGCSQGPREVVVSDVEVGGVKLSVRRQEYRFKRPCREEGLNLYKCLLVKPEKSGCVYLEVGGPLPKHTGDNPCSGSSAGRRVLVSSPAEIDFEADPAGARIAWRSGKTWDVAFVFERQLLVPQLPYASPNPAIPRSTSAIDWRALKTLEDAAPQLYFQAPPELQPGLLKRMRSAGGDRVVTQLLTERLDSISTPAWTSGFQSLDEAHRQEVLRSLIRSVFEDGMDDALPWYDAHPEVAPRDLEERLRDRAREWTRTGELDVPMRWLPRGYRRHDPAVGQIACEVLEQREVARHWNDGEMPLEEGAMPYAVIAATGSKCEAVSREFSSAPCSSELHCAHDDAGIPVLCDASDLQLLEQELAKEDGSGEVTAFDSAAKMNALLAQGPLPKSFVLQNARRLYRQVFAPDAGRVDDGSPCGADEERIADFLCEMRPELTRFQVAGCEVEIDDAKKVVRLWRPDEQDGGR